jgi:hypothetical protein
LGERFRFSIGPKTFAWIDRPSVRSGSCEVRLRIEGDQWSITGPFATREGDLKGDRPVVTGFFSGLDLRRNAHPSISVTTQAFGAQPTVRQTIAWVLSTICALAALVLVAVPRPRRVGGRGLAEVGVSLARSLRPVDGLVTALLLTWWIVGPVLFDDGWVKARQTNYDVSGGFSNYYTTFGSNLPLDFWVEWLQHWVVGNFDTLVVLRLPALAFLAATWIVCRWGLGRLLRSTGRESAGAEWALGITFSLNALSWAVTLRPEPVVALILMAVLVCAVRFVERPSAAPLAIASVLVALALSAHPAGLVTLAPLFVIARRIVAWGRAADWVVPAVVGAAGLALLIVLVTVSSDLSQRMLEARLVHISGDATVSWRDELLRYQFLGAEATTLRRQSVALMIVAVLAYLSRPERGRRLLLDLPAASLGVALLLLIATPSKWAWHFGALAGLSAMAVAAEVTRLCTRNTTLRWPVRPFLATMAIVLVIGWSWYPRPNWSSGLDLRTLEWMLDIEPRFPLVKLVSLSPLFVLGVAMVVVLLRRGMHGLWRVPSAFVAWLVPLAVLPLVAFNVTMLVADAVETPGWTLARQNLESLSGDAGCGLAEDTTTTEPSSLEPLRAAEIGEASATAGRWTPPSPLAGLGRFSLFTGAQSNSLATPWYALPPAPGRVGFFVSAVVGDGDSETVEARWGRRVKGKIRPTSVPVQARTLPSESCYESGALRRFPNGRLALHLRRIDGATRDGWAIEGVGYVTESEFGQLVNGAEVVSAPEGPGFEPATLPTCETGAEPEALGPAPPLARTRPRVASRSFRGDRVSVPSSDTTRSETIAWTFLPEGRLPQRPPDADVVQLILRSDAHPPRAVATTGAVSYRTTSLEAMIASGSAPPLVWPNLILYMPCTRLPLLARGIVEVPSVLVSQGGLWPIELETSPFHGALDLYVLRDLSAGDSNVEPEAMHVYWVDHNIPGTALAPAVAAPPDATVISHGDSRTESTKIGLPEPR